MAVPGLITVVCATGGAEGAQREGAKEEEKKKRRRLLSP